MVSVAEVSKLLGEILLVLKHLFSCISHLHPLFRDCAFLRKINTHDPLSQISPSSQIYEC